MPPPTDTKAETESADTGLPGLRTWTSVYLFVVVTFAVWLGVLSWLTYHFA